MANREAIAAALGKGWPPNREDIRKVEERWLLKLLASEQRLLLLCRLLEGETSVGELAEHAKLAQSATSQHLAKMRAEGLVATRRDAQTIYYRVADPAAVKVLEALSTIYRG